MLLINNLTNMKSVYVCPVDKSLMCSWEGSSEDILNHFILEHEDLLVNSNEIEVNIDLKSENRLMFHDEEIYLIQLKIQDDFLKITLRYLGPNHIAKKLSYDVKVKVDESLYIYNYFKNNDTILYNDDSWIVNLSLLKSFHDDLKTIQCIFDVSCPSRTESLNSNSVTNINNLLSKEVDDPDDTTNSNTEINESIQDDDAAEAINDEEIVEILDEIEDPQDALDKISCLNFNMFEKNDKIRRYSSFLGIPPGLFDIKETNDLSCSNCFINMLPPIYLCINDHSVCADCRKQKCRVCYENVTENRNKKLEEFSRKSLHLCRFHKEGCAESFTYYEIRNHELKCNFCTYICIEDCPYRGKFVDFQSHLKIHHTSCKLHKSTPVDFPKNSDFVVFDVNLGIFHCKCEVVAKNVYQWMVIYLGPNDRNFACDLSFKGGKSKDTLFLRRLDAQYSITQTKDDLRRMKVKEKNAVLTITKYFQ